MTPAKLSILSSLVLALAWNAAACGGGGASPTSAASGTSSSSGGGGGGGAGGGSGGGIGLTATSTGTGGAGGTGGSATTTSSSGAATASSSGTTTSSSSGAGTGGSSTTTTSSSSGTGTGGSTTTTTTTSSSTTTTTSSSSGAGGAGSDAGADAGCTLDSDCPPGANECVTATCTSGVCGTAFVVAGTPTSAQTAGDCHSNECDGAGNITDVVDDADLPTNSNPCTTAACTAGVPSNPPVTVGTSCGNGLVCNAGGMCVGCVTSTGCPGTDTECQTRTCTSGMCGLSFAPAGKQTAAQTPGDCHTNECDGAGHIVSAVDNTDIPIDTNQCTTATCTAGTPSTPPVAPGVACTQTGGVECNGAGACVQCLASADCPGQDTACQQRSCTAGACGLVDTGAGTVIATQTPGDCHTNECDGNGNIVSVVDDTDVPSSNNVCAPGICSNGTPSIMDAAPGTACAQNGGVECDGAGNCVQCVTAADCGTDTLCQTHTCTAGACGVSDVAAGTPEGTQTIGDCHTNECDGNGNLVNEIDDTDVPASSNPCAPGICTNGTPSTGNASQGTACAQDGGAVCDGQGACTQSFTVVRVGATGGGTLAATTTAVFLDTYYPLVGSSPVSSVALPTTVSGTNHPLTLSGTATSEGGITRSADGHYLSLAGYAAGTGLATTGTTRVVGRVSATGTVVTSTTLAATAFAGSSVRGAASNDGSSFWVSGTSSSTGGGVWYVTLGAAAGGTQVEGTPNNARRVAIFGGQLYADSGSGGFTAPFTVGTGLPTTTGAMATVLNGFVSSGANPYDFVLFGTSTLYIADDSAGVERWTLSGTTWTEDATFTALTSACLGVTGWTTSTGVTLIATTQSGTVQRIDVPTTGTATATLLVTASTNTAFRSVALAPH